MVPFWTLVPPGAAFLKGLPKRTPYFDPTHTKLSLELSRLASGYGQQLYRQLEYSSAWEASRSSGKHQVAPGSRILSSKLDVDPKRETRKGTSTEADGVLCEADQN